MTPRADETETRQPEQPQQKHLSARDARLLDDFIRFALRPMAATASRLPFAERVRLGLGPVLLGDLPLESVQDPSSWLVNTRSGYLRGVQGPFSATQLISSHVHYDSEGGEPQQSGDLQRSVGEHPHCASPPKPAPRPFEGTLRLSVQPADGSITSCLAWFTVDLYLDDARRIVAVTVDIWEP
ncbi:hypothetical protein [Nocardioides immobilis]|uniref:hypothetical protein n=1 Tax=Nocardioides immobilis TaxID=2049295 RepID=UPI0011C3676C|nr:hypothetical protein [Nocardioides immobilis]